MKDREDENENLVNKKQKLLKALEEIKVPVPAYKYFLFYIFLYSQTLNKNCAVTRLLFNYTLKTNFSPLCSNGM
jgi:hypothetical protein